MNSDAPIYWVSGKQITNITVQKLMFRSKQTCGMRGLIKEAQTDACHPREGRKVNEFLCTNLLVIRKTDDEYYSSENHVQVKADL